MRQVNNVFNVDVRDVIVRTADVIKARKSIPQSVEFILVPEGICQVNQIDISFKLTRNRS